jgi:hypothetical protein
VPRPFPAACFLVVLLAACAAPFEYESAAGGYRVLVPPGWTQGFGFDGPLGRVDLSLLRGGASATISIRPRETGQPFDRLARVLASGLRGATVQSTTAASRPAVLVQGWLDATWTAALVVDNADRLLVISAVGPRESRGEIDAVMERLRRSLRIRA